MTFMLFCNTASNKTTTIFFSISLQFTNIDWKEICIRLLVPSGLIREDWARISLPANGQLLFTSLFILLAPHWKPEWTNVPFVTHKLAPPPFSLRRHTPFPYWAATSAASASSGTNPSKAMAASTRTICSCTGRRKNALKNTTQYHLQ